MVAKISVGSSLFGTLSYNQNKVDEEQGKVLLSNRMFESEDGNFSIRRCMECFDMHLPADLKTEKPIIHISLNPHPDDVLSDSQLADIAISSAHTARVFGVEPRVAMLSYSTGSSGKGEAVDEVIEATKLAHERAPELLLDGPIQYDAAIDPEVARTKAPTSPVAGHASVFIFPDLNTGNNTYKAVQRAANALAIGPVLQGLNKPVNDLSRGCTVPDIINTVMITAIQAQAEKGLITLK